jgi:hypothetical protein
MSSKKSEALEFFTAESFLKKEFPKETHLVEPIIPLGGDVLLHGKGGIGKTNFAFTLAKDIMEGQPFLGMWPTMKGNVAVVQVDMPLKLYQDRVRMFGENFKGDMCNFTHILSPKRQRINVVDVVLNQDKHQHWIQPLLEKEPVLIIFDSLRKLHTFEEKDDTAASMVYGSWREILGTGATHMFLHHDRESFKGENRLESSRGNSAWRDDADTAIKLQGKGSTVRRLDKLLWTKHRTFEPGFTMGVPEELPLAINPSTLFVEPRVEDPREAHIRKEIQKGSKKKDIVDALQNKHFWTDERYPPLGSSRAYELVGEFESKMKMSAK